MAMLGDLSCRVAWMILEQPFLCRAEGGCAHDYDNTDMQQARCMLCRRRGHFCCQSTARLPALKRSCYNCGDRNHTGEECWRVCSHWLQLLCWQQFPEALPRMLTSLQQHGAG